MVADICNEMSACGNTVFLYIVNDLYDDSMLKAVDQSVQIVLCRRKPSGGGKLRAVLELTRFIRDNKIDVVHCNALNTPELLVLKPIAFPKTKIVYTVHNLGSYQTLGRAKIQYRNTLCHRLIAISESVRKDMLAAGADGKKLITIYNAIDVKRFPAPSSRCFDANFAVIGNVARIDSEKKGQDVLLRAIALLKDRYPNLICFLAGAADAAHQEDLQRLKQLVDSLALEANVRFIGNCENVPDFLATLDVFVLPSRSEGFGISLVEAMAMGVPCIASDLDGPREIINNSHCGTLYPSGRETALAEAIAAILEDYPVYQAQAQKAVALIRAQYDIRTMCDTLLKAYAQ